MKQLIAFDLDGTLAESKQPIGEPIATALGRLLGVTKVAVISGGDWPQFEAQVISRLPSDADLTKLFIMPATGTKLYRFEGGAWHCVYADDFSRDESAAIRKALEVASADQGLDKDQSWGKRIEGRGSQVTFSGLGQEAPLDAKKAWDPDFAKRKRLQAALQRQLPDLSINIGGSTSIDITRQGIDKAYGMRRLTEHSGVPARAMLFLGDAIYPGGNDYPVAQAGIDVIAVRDPLETMRIVTAIALCLASSDP
ncbi:HAD-IIB family hydrolase [Sphingomonas sp. S2-65]|uniref:HAD-IIB family hydrolase n=1 Tax=Sphingomonas sp. S2-65 TaxID=2903960 RepID=UPI001F1A3556|nr:HAD-IIB family hydrolase [Sphingomonas sp. S2-65]UYY59359.1 HAD-IIB family hydrolase [Sphingomonas sp. S2-65]